MELADKTTIKFSKRTENWLKLGMMLLGPFVLLVILEGTAYFWERNQSQGLYAWELVASRRMEWEQFPEPGSGYTLIKPGSRYEWQNIPVEINSNGLRGPETTYEKPANTYRILNLGDSIAMGWGVREEETYGRRLEQLLNKTAVSAQHYEVINAGVPGWNPANELAYLQAEGLRYEPDLILLDLTLVNDIYGRSALIARRPALIEWLRVHTYFWPFLTVQLRWLEARSQGRERIDVIDPPQDASFYFPQNPEAERWDVLWDWILEMNRLATENGARLGLILFPLEYQVLDEQYTTLPQEILIARAIEAGIPILDLLPVYQQACQEKVDGSCQLEDRYLFADVWMHPSAYGHEITASEIEGFLQEFLNESG